MRRRTTVSLDSFGGGRRCVSSADGGTDFPLVGPLVVRSSIMNHHNLMMSLIAVGDAQRRIGTKV